MRLDIHDISSRFRRILTESIHVDAIVPVASDARLSMTLLNTEKVKTGFVLSIEIHRLDELMLCARSPQHYSEFTEVLVSNIKDFVLESYGVFGSFSGGGILSFFPEVFSGEDAGARALLVAEHAHMILAQTYDSYSSLFTAQPQIRLGIGIDYGDVLLSGFTGLSIVGIPVVYAVRFSNAAMGETFINNSAQNELIHRYQQELVTERVNIEHKLDSVFVNRLVSFSPSKEPQQPFWKT